MLRSVNAIRASKGISPVPEKGFGWGKIAADVSQNDPKIKAILDKS